MHTRTLPAALWFGLFVALPLLAGRGPSAAADEPPRVPVPLGAVAVDDGDTVVIRWPDKPPETVRLLGIDAPEVQHLEHDVPYTQPFGEEARGFVRGCLAAAGAVELLRAPGKDPFGRTLGYLFVGGKNVSVLALEARLAVETVSHFGDNGLPGPAKDCLEAAARAGPVAFEAPHRYRRRMKDVAAWMKAQGVYPAASDDAR